MDNTYGFSWLKRSRHFTQETTVKSELIEPYNLPSTVLTVDLWLGNDDYETTKITWLSFLQRARAKKN